MPPIKRKSLKKTTKSTKRKSRRSKDCCSSSNSSSSSDETSSSDSSDTSESSDSCTDCCDCSDSDCSDCWDCKVPARNKRGEKKSRNNMSTKLPHKAKKKSARRTKYSASCDASSCESSDDCYDCVPRKAGKKLRA